ncbi:MAG: heavy-metal-associated domain-containing protein [Clostridiales bacterium]|jgi:copper chaperone|nr:heavy-metal-associated domain-containing protein [Clostridiales bacterium]
MTKTVFIEGMTCHNCVRHVKEALQELDGVRDVKVDLESKKAVIEADYEIADRNIIDTIDDIGYQVTEIR